MSGVVFLLFAFISWNPDQKTFKNFHFLVKINLAAGAWGICVNKLLETGLNTKKLSTLLGYNLRCTNGRRRTLPAFTQFRLETPSTNTNQRNIQNIFEIEISNIYKIQRLNFWNINHFMNSCFHDEMTSDKLNLSELKCRKMFIFATTVFLNVISGIFYVNFYLEFLFLNPGMGIKYWWAV